VRCAMLVFVLSVLCCSSVICSGLWWPSFLLCDVCMWSLCICVSVCPGTIIGKALEPLNEGQGEILTLITLQ